MDAWSWLWIAWGAAFVAIEGTALVSRHVDGTLSDNLRELLHTNTSKGARTASAIGLGVLSGWFIVHICVAGAVYP